jgi:hypothetical protein
MRWLIDAFRCCGKFTLFVAGLYAALGIAFILASAFMHDAMASVGIVLLLAGLSSLSLFLLIAYVGYRSEVKRSASDKPPSRQSCERA